ncbi:MAG: XRE family transcriptional regulator [Thermoleophilia bacterium]
MGKTHRWSDVRKAKVEKHPGLEERIAVARKGLDQAVALSSLVAARRALGVKQAEVAEVLGVSRARVSAMEQQDDLYVSTLQDYVEALGGRLELTAVFDDGGTDVPVSIPLAPAREKEACS